MERDLERDLEGDLEKDLDGEIELWGEVEWYEIKTGCGGGEGVLREVVVDVLDLERAVTVLFVSADEDGTVASGSGGVDDSVLLLLIS